MQWYVWSFIAGPLHCRGGHVAFIDGLWPFGKAWMDSVVVDFFSACHQNREKLPHQDRVSPRGRL